MAQKGAFAEFLMHYIEENQTEDLTEIQSELDDEEFRDVFNRSFSIKSANKDV